MAKGAFIGVSSKARKITKGYIGVNGIARKLKKGYIGVNGIARATWGGVTWKKYNCNVIQYYQRDSNFSGIEYSAHIGLNTAVFYSDYIFSESSGFGLTGRVEMSPENSVGYCYGCSDTRINKITSVTKSSSGGWDIKYKTVDNCTLYTQYRAGEYIDEVTVDEESLPEEGTLRVGSIEGDYCVINVNGTNYYYEKVS
jgi:hypothetical protein